MQIEKILHNMHRYEDQYRYILGHFIDEWARETVNSRLHSTKWERTNFRQDVLNKRDWVAIGQSGKPFYAQFKSRMTGNDILVCAYQPFYGLDDERTQVGRDLKYNNISYYVTYPPMGDRIMVSRATNIKDACMDLVTELKERNGSLPFYSKKMSDPKDSNSNERPACCQLRLKVEEGQGDRRGQHKMLAFLPPHLIKHQEIKVDPEDFKAYLTEKLKPRQAYFDYDLDTGVAY